MHIHLLFINPTMAALFIVIIVFEGELNFTGSPSQWMSFCPAPKVQTDLLCRDNRNQILQWIGDCRDNHPRCNNYSPGLPSRLLRVKVGEDENTPEIRLEDTNPIFHYDYVALSHVWALTTPLPTMISNLSQHRTSIAYNSLSKGLQDAITFTLYLGFSYIWIDSLCIIQNSLPDWESEAPRMALIYANAQLVFAAHGHDLGLRKTPPAELRDPNPARNDSYNSQSLSRRKKSHTYLVQSRLVHAGANASFPSTTFWTRSRRVVF